MKEDLPPDPTEDDADEAAAALDVGGPVEYRAPDGSRWSCGQAARLVSDYHITGTPARLAALLAEWHGAMSPVPQTWGIVRRFYNIAPLIGGGEAIEDYRAWTLADIAAHENLAVADIETHLVETQTHWSRLQLRAGLVERMASARPVLDEKATARLIDQYGFASVTDPNERAFIATRITELGHLLELETGRPLALSAIFQEILLRSAQAALLKKLGEGKSITDQGKQMEEVRKMQGAYEETMKKLGATQEQNPGYRKKVAFLDCMGQITRGIQDYYANGSTELIDGMNTAAEVRLLLLPTPFRGMQLRPDIILMMVEWKREFWNPTYQGQPFPKHVTGFLLDAMEKCVRQAVERKETGQHDDPLRADEEMAALELQQAVEALEAEREREHPAPEAPGAEDAADEPPLGGGARRPSMMDDLTPM